MKPAAMPSKTSFPRPILMESSHAETMLKNTGLDISRIILDVPPEVPAGKVVLTFTLVEAKPKKERAFGCAKGQFKIADDFDAPLEDFKDYM
jgi:hypothetical protein